MTINEAKEDEHGEECEDLIVARVVEIVYTVSGHRRIGVLWMYRIQVGACCVLRLLGVGGLYPGPAAVFLLLASGVVHAGLC